MASIDRIEALANQYKKKKKNPTETSLTVIEDLAKEIKSGNKTAAIEYITEKPVANWKSVLNTIENAKAPNDKSAVEKHFTAIGERIGYTAKSLGTGIVSGLSGLLEAGTTEIANNLDKGQKDDYKVSDSLLYLLNPTIGMQKKMSESIQESAKILTDKNSKPLEKTVGFVNNAVTDALNMIPGKDIFDETTKIAGSIAPADASQKVMETSNKITKPVYDLQQKVYEQGQQYGTATQLVGEAANSIGRMLPAAVATAATKNPTVGLGVMGVSVKGSSTTEALKKGAELNEAVEIGNTKAVIETGIEMLSGGVNIFGKGAIDDIIEKGIDKKVKKEITNYLAQKGAGIGAEVVEEVLTDILNVAVDKGTVDPNAKYSLEDLGETSIVTILSTIGINALTGGYGKSSFRNNTARMQENQAINKEVEARVKEKESIGITLTNQEKATIEQEVRAEFEQNKQTPVDNTAQVEGLQQAIKTKQQELSQSQDAREQQIIQEEIEVLEEELSEATNAQQITNETVEEDAYHLADKQVKQKYSKPVEISKLDVVEQNGGGKRDIKYWVDKIKQDGGVTDPIEVAITDNGKYKIYDGHHRLQAAQELGIKEIPVAFIKEGHYTNAPAEFLADAQQTTNEADLRKQNYVYQAQETDSDIKKAVYESASQVMNNTEKSRKLVEVVAKIAEERGTTYKFTNNEQLKQMGYAKENVTVNGLVNKNGEVLINIDSAKALNTVVGHETTHLLEGPEGHETEEYKALRKIAIEYAKSKGEYDTRYKQIERLYEGENANIEKELTADIVGDYLFTDEAFVKELSIKQPTLFEKIKNFISDLVVKFKGTEQEKQLRQLQRSFEKAYKAQGTKTAGQTQYSLESSTNENIQQKIDRYSRLVKEMQQEGKSADDWVPYANEILRLQDQLNNTKTKYSLSDNKIQGLEDYSNDEIKTLTNDYIQEKLEENGIYDVTIKDTAIHGSRGRGTARPDSDLDIVVEYEGDIREDDLFSILNEEPMYIDDIQVDINPITASDTGTLADYMERSKAYDKEILSKNKPRYSLSEDTEGRKLSDNQKEYFKNVIPELKDENGNLKVLYHGTPNEFTQFNYDFIGTNGTAFGKGFYLTDDINIAKSYTGDNGNVMELYANITNPMSLKEITISKNDFKKFVSEIAKQDEYWIYDYGDVDREGFNKVLNYAVNLNYDGETNDVDLIHGILNTSTLGWEEGFRVLNKILGYDGVIANEFGEGKSNVYIPFFPEQIKSITNENPTANPDINMSLSAQNEEIAPTGNWNVRGEDVRLQVEEAITPLQETITKLTEQVQTLQENVAPAVEQIKPEQVMQSTKPTLEEVKNLMDIRDNKSGSEYASAFYALRDKYGQVNLYKSLNEYNSTGTVTDEDFTAPTSQDIVEQQGQEAFDTITDEHAPSFEDVVDEVMWNEEFESTSTENIPSPFDTRDIDEVGNRKVKAYQYENPEVRPYFQQEAQNMMWDLNNTIKGERSFNDQLYYDSNGEQGFFGTTRQTTEAIAYLKDKYGYSYAQIEKGLNDIIEDNGKENNAVAKRIEFMLDERLREGYTTSDGIPIPPNEEYIKFLEEKQITEYNREISSTLTDADAPIEEEIEAPIEETPVEALPEPSESFVIDENTKGQLSVPLPETTAQNRNTELTDTSTETQEQEKVAQILSERPTQENKKQRTWAKARAAFLDKGSVFEDLSIKTKNRELMAKWDYALTSEARAQNVMMNGTYEYNKATKERTRVGKGLEEIRTEVGNKVQEFSEYLYHRHNVDRMSIESNAQARMAELRNTTLKGYDFEAIEKLSRKRIPNKADKVSEQLQFKDVAKQAEVEINAAKEYMRLTEAKNKPVFGNSVTAEISQQRVDEFEMKNPEFMDWANDVYDYNKANLNQLVNGGVISQETADQFAEIYPNYVPIGRADVKGNAVNVPLDTNRTGVNVPIARATGGNSDILPLFDTMAKRTIQTYRAVAKNSFGVELKNTLNSTIENQQTNVDEILDNVDQQENLLQEGKNGQAPTFTVFENGEKVTYEITEDMFDALKPVSEGLKGNILWGVPNKISSIHRGVLTEYNPVFMLTNAIKDSQDILLNSQHATKTYAKMPEAYAQILRKGYWYQEYMANGGEQNSYFDSQEGSFDTERKGINKILDLPPLKQISQINNVIEMSPRLAEYIASRESGRSIETSMLDAARVTTNFKAGGDITKWVNRNGATFLNASIQGAMQQVRNVREANMNGLKGYANLASKFALAGVPAMILNAMLWGDDEDYEELSDYVKQSYWIVGKYGDGNFIRIPKGRMITVVQEALNQMTNLVTGNDEADLGQFLEIVGNNIAPNNPIENNILSPILQAVTNKTWYGGDLVPTRLQDVPAEEQYDESTDKLSIAIGQATGISPYKINYVLDQYTGGVGDVFLPMMTQQAEGGKDDLVSNLLAPLTNKFTVDSTMKNQSVADLYDLSDELTTKANSSKATDEDILKNKFVNSVKSEMNELYKQKREIQNSDLSDSEKYNQVREIQGQINTMAKEATTNYENVTIKSDYSKVGNKEYYKNSKEQWEKVDDKELTELDELNMSISDKNTYFKTKKEINKIKGVVEDTKDDITLEEDSEEYKDAVKSLNKEQKESIVNAIIDTGFTDQQKAYLYKKTYNSDTVDTIVNAQINVDDYLIYTTKEFKADYNSKGNAISGSRKDKVINYVATLNLTRPQMAILIKSTNTFKFNDYNGEIVNYVGNLDIDYDTMVKVFKDLDMTVKDGRVYWDE